MAVHPWSTGAPPQPRARFALARHPCGTRRTLLTAASFRTWQGS